MQALTVLSEIVGKVVGSGVDGAGIGVGTGGGTGSGGGELCTDVFSGVLNISSSELDNCCSKVRGPRASSILSERLVVEGWG